MTVEVGSDAAVPVTFEGLFGWLHPAAGERGVVLCGACGFEQMAAHRPWRALAEGLAGAGCPTLRFDYPGEGNSADSGEKRVAACVAAIRQAIRFLRATAGVTEILLVGLRLGATFATLAAQNEAVEGLVLLAPVSTGRAYLREMRLRAQTIGRLPDGSSPPQEPDSLSVGGFRMESAFLADLADVNLVRLERAPAGRVLLLAQETRILSARLEALGCEVTTGPLPGLAALVSDPIFSEVPAADFARVTGFATQGVPGGRPLSGGSPLGAIGSARLTGLGWEEEPVRFARGLFGIRCRPHRADATAPTILFVSTGMSVHSGWGRQTTDLARRLAADGIGSFRFDQRGIGDSVDRPDRSKPLFAADGFADVLSAIDQIADTGGPILLVGGCSGAYAAFHALCRDSRVDGALLLNLYCFDWDPDQNLDQVIRQTFGSASTYAALLKRGATWRRLIHGEIRIGAIAAVLAQRGIETAFRRMRRAVRHGPPGGSPARRIAALRRRGAEIRLLYSAGDPGLSALRRQLGSSPGRADRRLGAPVTVVPGVDHNFGSGAAQARVAEALHELMRAVKRSKSTRSGTTVSATPGGVLTLAGRT
ncbi:thioesterase [Methylobacterium sp. P1-11]|uniref:alpha/beta fold hydrolase n=1 Tax=Methylobacterium sp. P1-11 TaxID=2024616 RepID=UPI0011ED7F74|nr:alpha/beta fold hydrolase [Methylobacterium sp. P1-11]KAA0124691.1 thioesterase [Methylobacterium sp. P1-11]